MLAARAITGALSHGAGVAATRDYSGWINAQFDDVAGLLALYGRLQKPPGWVARELRGPGWDLEVTLGAQRRQR
jgi:hypothetical protein